MKRHFSQDYSDAIILFVPSFQMSKMHKKNIKGLDGLPGDTGHMAAVLDINVISPLI